MSRHCQARIPDPDVVQYATAVLIEAEEVEPPSIWSTALDPVEEGAMALFQQSILAVLTIAFHDEVFACKRACQRPVPVLGRRVRHRAYPEASHLGIRTVAKLANRVAARIEVAHGAGI